MVRLVAVANKTHSPSKNENPKPSKKSCQGLKEHQRFFQNTWTLMAFYTEIQKKSKTKTDYKIETTKQKQIHNYAEFPRAHSFSLLRHCFKLHNEMLLLLVSRIQLTLDTFSLGFTAPTPLSSG
ncbi:hypothetical protein VIGAN_09173900 [Vigna angularis var. angularis]|uniref:Uncharacterized protein n=1 Tax=Vigna angularis var. angularis TaxID=157739 RepID=A0A0S3SZH6_PHAAN|nr:hypothetical protein VIGAN_09173900 [Vigna angularis var. angularis]